MNAARAEVPLPPWFRHLLGWLVQRRWRWGSLRLGLTEGGWILAGSVLGAWAAAISSGNNLLVLAAALGSGVLLAALVETLRLMRRVSADGLCGSWLVEPGQTIERPLASLGMPARLFVRASIPVQMEIRDDGVQALLRLAVPAQAPRGVYFLKGGVLVTSSPAGVFVVERVLAEATEIVIPPMPHPLPEGVQRAQDGMSFEDLRRYAPGDALARVHWRRAAGRAPEHWLVKHFAEEAQAAATALTVDLRLHGHPASALEALLGAAWAEVRKGRLRRLRVGARTAELQGGILSAARLLARARPEQTPPPVVEGRLLSLAGAWIGAP